MTDTIIEAIKLVADSSMASDRALLTAIEAIAKRLQELQEQVDFLLEVHVVNKSSGGPD